MILFWLIFIIVPFSQYLSHGYHKGFIKHVLVAWSVLYFALFLSIIFGIIDIL